MDCELGMRKNLAQMNSLVSPNVSYASLDRKRSGPQNAQIKVGTVRINCITLYDAAAPFGGYKSSGYGRDLGSAALEQYTETKCVWVGLE